MDQESSILIRFHDRAHAHFDAHCKRFDQDAALIDRQHDENRFRELKETHVRNFKRELEQEADRLISQSGHRYREQDSGRQLHQLIRDYLHRFVQKVNNL